MPGNEKDAGKPSRPPGASGGVRLEAHWRTVSWSGLDKGLQLVYGIAFLLLVVRPGGLPLPEVGLQGFATTIQIVLSQIFRSLLLIPLIKYVAEAGGPQRIAATGAMLYAVACTAAAVLLAAGSSLWASLATKPELAAVLVPTAALLAASSIRDAAIASLEGERKLRTLFRLDLAYYILLIGALVAWRVAGGTRLATTVQWVQCGAALAGSLIALVVTRRALLLRPARREAQQILRFGAGSFGSGLGATLQQQGDEILAGRLMGAADLALYITAKRGFRAFNILAQAVNQVLIAAASRLEGAGRKDDLRVLFEKSVCFLALALVPICILLIVFAAPAFTAFFSGTYEGSVRPFQILVASALTLPLATVGSAFLTGLGRLRSLVWITWVGVLIALLLTVLWVPRWGPSGAAAATLVAAVFGMVARAIVLRPVLGFEWRGIMARTRDAVAFVRRRLAAAR